MNFNGLPTEILPLILSNIYKPSLLGLVCLLNRDFQYAAIPLLYENITMFSWLKDGKSRVLKLFYTLSQNSSTAKFVRRLEIRDSPKSFSLLKEDILYTIVSGIRNCVNLRSCTWTRDGSLNNEVLCALVECRRLRILELNGNTIGNYDPKLLLHFKRLSKISLLMPTAPLVAMLPEWIKQTGQTLKDLTIICKGRLITYSGNHFFQLYRQASPIITDDTLSLLAPNVTGLSNLCITGCPKITEDGIMQLISSNVRGIRSLGFEALSTKFDAFRFNSRCNEAQALRSLESITLAISPQIDFEKWSQETLSALRGAPLKVVQVYSLGSNLNSMRSNGFWNALISDHGCRLKKIGISRVRISLDTIHNFCSQCPELESLFVAVEEKLMSEIGDCLSLATKLQVFHVNFSYTNSDKSLIFSPDEALGVVKKCPPTIRIVGFNTQVWQVDRTIVPDEHGELRVERKLGPYDTPEIPEAFLAVHA